MTGRLPPRAGEEISRARQGSFKFDGRRYAAYEGDTIASALSAAGVRVLSRSFKYHRPRGLLCCAGRCPNCMVEVNGVPNVRACTEAVRDGMQVKGQNAWPSVRNDFLALFDRFDRLLPVGFYYKTFIRPRWMWPVYEGVLRRLAGLGRVEPGARPDLHPRKRHLYCDVAVIGGGPAGCLAALGAAAEGARVVLVDDQPQLGGHLRLQAAPATGDDRIAGMRGFEAAKRLASLVAASRQIEHLGNAAAFGFYEGRLIGVSQGNTLVKVRACRVVIATGSAERPALFENNDLPGVMLGSAALRLARLYGVRAGNRAVVAANDDRGWGVALELIEAGLPVVAVVDSRDREPAADAAQRAQAIGAEVLPNASVVAARGKRAVTAAVIEARGKRRAIRCDLLVIAGRTEPLISLPLHDGLRARFDEQLGEFVAGAASDAILFAGHIVGTADDSAAIASGPRAGRAAAMAAMRGDGDSPSPRSSPIEGEEAVEPRSRRSAPIKGEGIVEPGALQSFPTRGEEAVRQPSPIEGEEAVPPIPSPHGGEGEGEGLRQSP
ncbi:MAG: (2Fe-2S)-binding protein, partial [Chloroflexi bacterium]|nr:(2Fe-2S)-binding protein [Chloroflexota bacterium]